MKNIVGWCWDIEGDNLYLQCSTVWYLRLKSLDGSRTEVIHPFRMDKEKVYTLFMEWVESFPDGALVVGHNELGYDSWVMWKLFDIKPTIGVGGKDYIECKHVQFVDTLYLSQFYEPDLPSHSLEFLARGSAAEKIDYRQKLIEVGALEKDAPKGAEFKFFHPLMEEYCDADVDANIGVFNRLVSKMKELYGEDWLVPSFRSGQKGFFLMNAQSFTGVAFDRESATSLHKQVVEMMNEIESRVLPQLPPRKLKKGEESDYSMPAKPFKKNGEFSSHMLNFIEKHKGRVVDDVTVEFYGKLYKVEGKKLLDVKLPMELKDQDDFKNWLIEQGWKPTFYNFQKDSNGKAVRDPVTRKLILTSPKLQENGKICPNLEAMEGELIKDVVRFLSLRNRLGVLEGWLKNERLDWDGRLPGGSSGITSTHRQRHTCVVNVAKVGSVLGEEMRSLFKAEDGMAFVGCDSAALENRVTASYTWKYDDGAYADRILNGDSHSFNAVAFFPEETKGFDPSSPDHDKEHPLFKKWRGKAKNGLYCVPMDTRALTRTGWKFYHEVEVGDEVLGYDENDKTKKWTKVLHKVQYDSSPVYEFGHNWLRLRATGEHRWFVKQRKEFSTGKPNFSIRESVEEVRTTDELNSESSIIMNAPMNLLEDKKSSNARAVLSDKYSSNWEERVLLMSQEERVAFLEGFMIADGCMDIQVGNWTWAQNDGKLFEAALLATYLVHDGVVQVSNNKHNSGEIKKVKLSKKSHRGLQTSKKVCIGEEPVWCITTELGSWVMRQGDVITITGNCLLYGGQAPKLAATLGIPEKKGKVAFEAFWDANPALRDFRDAVTAYWNGKGKKHLLPAIDGRILKTRSQHSLVNQLCQSAGAIATDIAILFFDHEMGGLLIDEKGRPYYEYKGCIVKRVLYQHDECQFETSPEIAEEVGQLFAECIRKAGRFLKMKVPLDGEYKVATNWMGTH